MNVIISEWVKLRRGSMLLIVLALAAVTTFGGIASVLTAGQTTPKRGLLGAGSTSNTVAALMADNGLAHALGSASTLLGVIVLGVTAALVAGEYSNGTLRNLLVREPRRVRLLAGKLVAISIATVAAVAVAVAVAIAGTLIAAAIQGYDASAWGSSNGIWDTVGAAAELAGAAIGWVIFGAVLAVAFRSSVLAIVIGVVWALPLESIVAGLDSGIPQWLPGKLLGAIAAGGNTTATLNDAILTFGSYAVVALAGAFIYFARKDVSK